MNRAPRFVFPLQSVAVLAFAAILSVPAHAQAPPSGSPHAGETSPGMMRRGAGEDAPEMVLERMKKRLSLTAEQEQMLKPILEENAKKLREMREKRAAGMQQGQTGPDPEVRKQLMAMREENDAKIEKILTPAQLEEWNKMRAEARDRMEQRRKGGGDRNMAPPPPSQN